MAIQNQKLKEINWHQTHAFQSHMKNIKNYNHVLKIEKNTAHKEELISYLMEELTDLEGVSDNMVKSLEKQAWLKAITIICDDMAHFLEW